MSMALPILFIQQTGCSKIPPVPLISPSARRAMPKYFRDTLGGSFKLNLIRNAGHPYNAIGSHVKGTFLRRRNNNPDGGSKENAVPEGYPTTKCYNPKLSPKVKLYTPDGMPSNPALERDIRIRRVHLKENGSADFEHALFGGMNGNPALGRFASIEHLPINPCGPGDPRAFEKEGLQQIVYRLLSRVDQETESSLPTLDCTLASTSLESTGGPSKMSLLVHSRISRLLRGDVVVLRTDDTKTALGVVQHSTCKKGDPNSGMEVTVRVRGENLNSLHNIQYLCPYFNLTSYENEYRSLMSLRDSSFCHPIINASLAAPFRGDSNYASRIQSAYGLDSHQADILISLLCTKGVSVLDSHSEDSPSTADDLIVALTKAVLVKQPPRVTDAAKAKPKRKVLLCSTDGHVLDRLSRTYQRSFLGYLPERSVLRIDNTATVSSDLLDISLTTIIQDRREAIAAAADKYSRRLDDIKAKMLDYDPSHDEDDRELDNLEFERERERLERLKDNSTVQLASIVENVTAELVRQSDVICADLEDGWIDLPSQEFDMIIVLGASRMASTQALMSFVHTNCQSVVLVGDSSEQARSGIGETMFGRLARLNPSALLRL
ncbi:hypothetical protein HGRIS_013825 [Hohenbuehelia grisea]|uniref:DNA2/NAM7 helicase helicase domain-containing protein n=2 Tax=Hohenbuehelia grisea TaxID=104357 RepID=A0ABR3IWN6_9AGAR